eukprot:11082332-Lingulodinium_polyedra.AAC.1
MSTRVHNGHYCWLYIESTMGCAILPTMANTEAFTVVYCKQCCTGHCRLYVKSTIETMPT